jgi:hypothetical protein
MSHAAQRARSAYALTPITGVVTELDVSVTRRHAWST